MAIEKCPHCNYYTNWVDLHVRECSKNPDNVPFSKACEMDRSLSCPRLMFDFTLSYDGAHKGVLCDKRCGTYLYLPKNWI